MEKIYGKENLKATIPSTDFDSPKTTSECEYFNYLDSIITYAGCTREIKSRIVMAQAAFNTKTLFTSKLRLKFKEETTEMLHLEHSFVRYCNLDTLKVLKCGAREEWRSSRRPIV